MFSLIDLDVIVIVIVINRRLWLKTFCLYCYFSVFGGITDKCDEYRENWVRIVLFLSKPVDVVDWFEFIR